MLDVDSRHTKIFRVCSIVGTLILGLFGSVLIAPLLYALCLLAFIHGSFFTPIDITFEMVMTAIGGFLLHAGAIAIAYQLNSSPNKTFLETIREKFENSKTHLRKEHCKRHSIWLPNNAETIMYGEEVKKRKTYYLAKTYHEVLGMGLVPFNCSLYRPSNLQLLDDEWISNFDNEIPEEQEKAQVVTSIWKYVLHGTRLHADSIRSRKEDVKQLGHDLGVDAMLEAYLAGVPLEHIIAK